MIYDLVITGVGPDRHGLVASFASEVFDAGGNLAKSRMVNLSGQFAFVAHVEATPDVLEQLKLRLRETGPKLGLKYEFSAPPGTPIGEGIVMQLKTFSLDQRGIVKGFSYFLEERGINIEELDTEIESSVGDGSRIFIMRVVMLVPRAANINVLRRELEVLGETLNCNIALDRVSSR